MTTPAGPGGLLPFGAVWLPSPAEVAATMGPDRQSPLLAAGMGDDEIWRLIQAKGGAMAAELPASLPAHLWQSAHDYVMYAAAAELEARCFPEQGNLQDSNRAWWSSQAGIEMARLRSQLGEDPTGSESPYTGTVPLSLPGGHRDRARLRYGYGGGIW